MKAPFSMKKIPAHTTSSPPRRALVYRIVFERALARAFVVVLLCSFSLQTVERSFAYEEVPVSPTESFAPVTDETLAVLSNEVADRADVAVVDEEAPEGITDVSPSEDLSLLPDEIPAESDAAPSDQVSAEESIEQLDDTTTEEPVDVPVGDTAVGDVSSNEAVASTTDLELELSSTTATTTDESIPTLTVESDQMIQFQKTNCLAVEDGSFYCQQASTTAPTVERGLFALPDADGDLEIYVKDNNDLTQVSFNTVDDASPYYDPASDSIVWHRLIDERYQIVVHDVASGEEFQLTDTSTNNMEPFRADNVIVWQHWANDAWQIMMYDGNDIKQLTETVEHNLAPVVRNNLVVWHRVMYGEKTIEVYDFQTDSYMTIKDDNGGTISNPRMVLVYDAAMDNGDIITRGYDLVTGEITSFAAEPAPVPDEIPDPDATGETRALLNSKATEEESAEGLELGTTTPSDPVGDIGTSTPPDLILDLTEATSTVDTPATIFVPIPDLIIEPFVASTSPADIPVVE
jgi:hypothetical protein